MDDSFEKFKESINPSVRVVPQCELRHPHTEVIDSFDSIDPVSEYSEVDSSYNYKNEAYLSIDLSNEDFEAKFEHFKNMVKVYEHVKSIRELGK